MAKVVITGGAGMVGSHCAEYFARSGDNVVVLDNLMRSELFGYDKKSVEYNWQYLSQFPNIKRIKGDVRNDNDLKQALEEDTELIIHTAGQPGVPLSMREPKMDFSINAKGTINTLEHARQICPKATVCYCSTNKIYGENVDGVPLVEEDRCYRYEDPFFGIKETFDIDLAGHTPYGVSKYVGDLYVQEYAHIYGMKTGVFRMSCTYGIRQFGFEDQGWVAWFAIATMFDKEVTIYGNGKQVRDLLYVDDLVRAFDTFHKSDVHHGVFNIGGGLNNSSSLYQLIDEIEKLTGKKLKYKLADWRPSDQRVYISDISHIYDVLNWKPVIGVKEGMIKLIEWTEAHAEYFK